MKQLFLTSVLLLALIVSSCSNNDSEETTSKPKLAVLFSLNGLGDMGYNDNILKGLQTIEKERTNVEVKFHTPSTMVEAERIFSDWLSTDTNGEPSLFILTNSDYEEIVAKQLGGKDKLDKGKNILLFESNNPNQLPIHHFQISLYGASYLAGVTAAHSTTKKPLIVLGNSNDNSIKCAANGFEEGYKKQTDTEKVTTHALANDWSGYAKEAETYQLMSEWAKEYGFIYAVAGSSNAGIYRYLNEHPEDIYTAGMDTDQSHLCTQIVGSMIKHIDTLIEHFVAQWIDTGKMPEETTYGLESGYIDWVLAPSYKDTFQQLVEQARSTAISKEKEYNTNN